MVDLERSVELGTSNQFFLKNNQLTLSRTPRGGSNGCFGQVSSSFRVHYRETNDQRDSHVCFGAGSPFTVVYISWDDCRLDFEQFIFITAFIQQDITKILPRSKGLRKIKRVIDPLLTATYPEGDSNIKRTGFWKAPQEVLSTKIPFCGRGLKQHIISCHIFFQLNTG